MNEFNWVIEQQCPQCGAPIILEETDKILACGYCRTRVYLTAKSHFRYYIAPKTTSDQEIFFIPYWRMKGIAYTLEDINVPFRVFDNNILAIEQKGLPISLGLRPQVLQLKFVAANTPGYFIEPRQKHHYLDLDQATNLPKVYIGETTSIIYSPIYFVNSCAFDAVLNRKLFPEVSEETVKNAYKESPAEKWQIKFTSTLCPQCGADTEGEKNSLTLSCRNCESVWSPAVDNFDKIEFAIYAEDKDNTYHLPFWRIKAKIEGVKLQSYADLIRFANLPKVATAAWEETPLYFYAPAFKINPALFLRWCKQMTSQPWEEEIRGSLPRQSVYPVTLTAAEVAESWMISLMSLTANKRRFQDIISTIKFTAEEMVLVYHPFSIGSKELIHKKSGYTIDKNALTFATNL